MVIFHQNMNEMYFCKKLNAQGTKNAVLDWGRYLGSAIEKSFQKPFEGYDFFCFINFGNWNRIMKYVRWKATVSFLSIFVEPSRNFERASLVIMFY